MKRFTTFAVAVLVSFNIQATNYFLSNDGNDKNNGTSETTPWQTIARLNQTVFKAGDTIFLRSGDVFRGTITVNQSGTATSPIVFTSYGSGEKPIISGVELVTGWNNNNGIYQANFNGNLTSFFSNQQEMTIARYPNDHQYLTLDSGATNYVKDASITSLSSDLFTDAKICIHSAQWCWERSQITSLSSDQINFTPSIKLAPIAQYGYFVYGKLVHLDVNNEFYYDSTAQILYFKSAVDPNTITCEASVYTNGFEIGSSASYINISQLQIEKQTFAGIAILSETNTFVSVDNCVIKSQFKYGISDKGKNNTFSNNLIEGADGMGIFCWGKGGYANIHHNTIKNIGLFRNYGDGSEINGTAIKCAFVNNCHVHHNTIESTGYCGVSVDGGYHLVERNIISNVMLLNNDGAALKSFGVNSHHITIQNNFVTTSDGNTEGTFKANFITPAIYFDFDVNNCLIQNNTVYNRTQKGIFLNAGTNNNTVKGNIIHGFNYGIDLNGSVLKPTPMTGMNISENTFFAKSASAFMIRMVDNTGGYKHGTIDKNYYFNPYGSSNCAIIPVSASSTSIYSLSEWQLQSNFDLNTKESFVSWSSNTSDEVLFMNPTDDVLEINLDTIRYVDLDNNEVCGNISLSPFTSKILIKTQGVCSSLEMSSFEKTDTSIVVFPNPFKNNLNVQLNSNETSYMIRNSLGQCLMNGVLNQGNNSINLDHFPLGVYFLTTNLKDGTSIKIIKN